VRIAIDGYRVLAGTGAAGGIRRRIEHDAQPAPLHSSSTAETCAVLLPSEPILTT
jgi:hypothetical protein